jgi:predicted nucleotidyltransferase
MACHFDMPHVPNIGTIVPNMGTRAGALSSILFSGSRRSILALLYGHADEQFYLREITRRAGTGIGATQRELRQLSEAGLIQDVRRGRQVYYQANRKNPIFVEMKSILAKTSGIRDILHEALTSLKDRIKLAFVYGSIARGEEKASSDVDLMVVGGISFSDVVSTLAKIETKLGREVNPTVYGPREFREKLAAKNHFLSAVAKENKLFVIGDEREFRRLGQERLARRA